MLTIESATSEKLGVVIRTKGDPSGTPPSFAVGTGTDPGTFANGTWSGSWDSTTGEIEALTPTIGAAGTLVVAGATDYRLYARWTVSGETPVKVAAILRVV